VTHKEIIKDIKKGQVAPIYFLHGEESYYIDELVKYMEGHLLTEDQKAFNMTTLYGKDSDFKQILDSARRYPIMAERQLVLVKEAQNLKTIDNLEAYLKNPLETTTLVFAHKHKKLDKRKKFSKALTKAAKEGKAVVLETKKLYDNQLPDWISQYLKSGGFSIEPKAADMLAEYLGNDLGKIANELNKLMLSLPKGTTVDQKLIEENIGISKDYNVFELQSALANRDHIKAYRIVQYYMANPKSGPLPMVVGVLYNFFNKAYICRFLPDKYDTTIAKAIGQRAFGKPGTMSKRYADYRHVVKNYSVAQLENALQMLKEYDLRSKGVGLPYVGDEFSERTDHGELMREMVMRILG
jgi:DNA polymerase-3 subunit delta